MSNVISRSLNYFCDVWPAAQRQATWNIFIRVTPLWQVKNTCDCSSSTKKRIRLRKAYGTALPWIDWSAYAIWSIRALNCCSDLRRKTCIRSLTCYSWETESISPVWFLASSSSTSCSWDSKKSLNSLTSLCEQAASNHPSYNPSVFSTTYVLYISNSSNLI